MIQSEFATTSLNQSLPLAAVEISLRTLLREGFGTAFPVSIRIDSVTGAVSFITACEVKLRIESGLQRIFDHLRGNRASLTLVSEPRRKTLVTLGIKWTELSASGAPRSCSVRITNFTTKAVDFSPNAKFEGVFIAIYRPQAFDSLVLQAVFANANQRDAKPVQRTAASSEGRVSSRDGGVPAPNSGSAKPTASNVEDRARAKARDLESYVVTLADFEPHLARVAGTSVNREADALSIDRDNHEYVWLADIPGFRDALNVHTSRVIEMVLEGETKGAPNIEAFLGLKYDTTWRNTNARPRRPATVRLNEGFVEARIGLRVLGHGVVEGLKIHFKFQQTIEEPKKDGSYGGRGLERNADATRSPIASIDAKASYIEQGAPTKLTMSKTPAPAPHVDSYVLKLANFAARIAGISGVLADLEADLLSVEREKHEYLWLADLTGLSEALKAQAGHTVQMTIDGIVRGAPNIEAFLGLKYGATWKNAGARPRYPVAVRLTEGFTDARVGLRLLGRGSIEGLKVGFRIQPELEVHNRIALRRLQDEVAHSGRLKIALIGDPFTLENFDGVADKILIKPYNWRSLLKVVPPDFLFVESAWVGNGGAWANRIVNNIEELESLVAWCKSASIPTIFWNKEDPVHFHRFLKAARLFDLVYTTCAESVRGYENEGLRAKTLPFSVNLATYNPIGSGQARGRYGIFAGAYYGQKYPDRTADMELMLDLTMRYGLRIFDRNAGSTSEEFVFPERFRASIVGSADARQLDKEYKRSRLAINVNTVKDSRSMFARRVFELAITGTPTISNFSPALVEMFGDGLVASDNREILAEEIRRLFEDDRHWSERRKSLMRTALMQHTIQDRLQTILQDLDVSPPPIGAGVSVFGNHPSAVSLPSDQFPDVRVLQKADAETPLWRLMPRDARYAAVALPGSRWSGETLAEFLRHQEYAHADVLGEAQGSETFRFGDELRNSLMLVGREALLHGDFTFNDLKSGEAATRLRELGLKTFGVKRLTEASKETPKPEPAPTPPKPITGWWPDSRDLALQETPSGEIEGTLAKDTHAYVRVGDRHKFDAPPATSYFPPAQFRDGVALDFCFDGKGAVFEATLHVFFYRDGERLCARLVAPNTSGFVRGPEGWTHVALAVRVKGQGDFAFRASVDEGVRAAEDFVGQALGPFLGVGQAWLCLSSVYPRQDNLYRNAFVHTRVKSYLAAKKTVVVVSMEGADAVLSTYEFEGVRVFAGAGAGLGDVLRARAWDCVACHIVSLEMLRVMDEHAPGIRKVVWIHAIEAERWYRRSFDVDVTAPDLEKVLRNLYAVSAERNGAVRLVYERSGRGLSDCRVIFVSHWFRRYIGCVDVRPEPGEYRVINNPIPTNLFVYRRKKAEDRFRWMSVRPYVSLKYGNDMTVAAIVALSGERWFDEVLVTLVGRGALWEETVGPVRGFKNVTLENRFLTQHEIADYHGRHGIFVGPTRSDSQGVSLGEAMSSGLVPVSNDCQAISEFVPKEWGLLAPPDDAMGLAVCIKRLVENPDHYLELSEKGSRHIREKCGHEKILEQEIAALTDP